MRSLEALLLGTKRSIQSTGSAGLGGETIIPDVIISETHSDEVVVTQHPVDTGAQVSDHAYRKPSLLVCEFGWSSSSRLINSLMSGSFLKGMETVNDVYAKLIRLKDERQLLKVSTAKRVYDNMLITKLQTTTTVDSENCAVIEITFEEVIQVQTKTVALASVMQDQSRTGGMTDQGNKKGTPAQQLLNVKVGS